jgi:hypothetical protein
VCQLNTAAVFAVMVTLAPIRIQESRGEGPYEAIDRYYTIAESIAEQPKALRPYLIVVGWKESGFWLDVHSGALRGDNGRSWGLFQFHVGDDPNASLPGYSWCAKDVIGTRYIPTLRAASYAAWRLRALVHRCSSSACVFGKYGGVKRSAWHTDDRITDRVNVLKKVRYLLRQQR